MANPQRADHDDVVRGAVRCHRGGFTLVELLVTILIMAIAAIVVIPSMGSTGILRVQALAREVVSDIAFVQSDAVAYQERRVIWFGRVPQNNGGELGFEDGNGYSVGVVTGPEFDLTTMWLNNPEKLDAPFARNFTRPNGQSDATISADFGGDNPDWLIFDELGGTVSSLTGTDPGQGGTITVTSALIAYEIDVEGLTGRTTVQAVDEDEAGGEGGPMGGG